MDALAYALPLEHSIRAAAKVAGVNDVAESLVDAAYARRVAEALQQQALTRKSTTMTPTEERSRL